MLPTFLYTPILATDAIRDFPPNTPFRSSEQALQKVCTQMLSHYPRVMHSAERRHQDARPSLQLPPATIHWALHRARPSHDTARPCRQHPCVDYQQDHVMTSLYKVQSKTPPSLCGYMCVCVYFGMCAICSGSLIYDWQLVLESDLSHACMSTQQSPLRHHAGMVQVLYIQVLMHGSDIMSCTSR